MREATPPCALDDVPCKLELLEVHTMIRTHVALGILTASVLCACSQNPQLDSYATALQQTRAAVEAHRARAATAKDRDSCRNERGEYGDEARQPLADMEMMSGGMTQGGMMQCPMCNSCPMCRDAGFAEGCARMQGELDQHLDAGCTDEAPTNSAEITGHCDRMDTLLDAEQQRLDQLMGGSRCGG
jgi:hypothetical protein